MPHIPPPIIPALSRDSAAPASAGAGGIIEAPKFAAGDGIYLAAEPLKCSTTTIAHTGTITVPDTAADFWAMLAAALGEGRRG